MFKKTIKYEDFNGNEITEDFYFNLTQAELIEMETKQSGGLQAKLERIVNTRDVSAIMDIFKEIITLSYGEKSDDGKHFNKSKEITDSFISTNAYSELYVELLSDVDKAIEFVTKVVPAKLIKNVNVEELKNNPQLPGKTN